LLEDVDIPDGTEVLVTIFSEEAEFWSGASRPSLSAIWDNAEDDVNEWRLKR